jgi:hypothetical protein
VNFFGSVPLPLHSAQSSSGFFVSQSSEADGWKQVMSDLKKAADALPVSYASADLGRATRGAALAYLGKAYLFNKDFSDAATQFKAVIDLGVYSLVANYKDNFTDAHENNAESVFEVQFSRQAGGTDLGWQGIPSSGWGKTSARAITFAPRSFGWTDVQPTFSVLNEFRQEKTIDGKIDPRLLSTIFYNDTVDTHLASTPMYQTTFQARLGSNAGDFNDVFCRK